MENFTNSNFKECPYCHETIKSKAVYCRYCHHDLTAPLPYWLKRQLIEQAREQTYNVTRTNGNYLDNNQSIYNNQLPWLKIKTNLVILVVSGISLLIIVGMLSTCTIHNHTYDSRAYSSPTIPAPAGSTKAPISVASPPVAEPTVQAVGSTADVKPSTTETAASVAATVGSVAIAPAKKSSHYYSGEFEGEYHTSKHSIRISRRNGKYLYQAWKQPKTMDEGYPDLILTNGEDSADGITFKKGNLVIDINRSNTADKELYIFINNVYRDHYYMYKD
jgi:hypothetical protein